MPCKLLSRAHALRFLLAASSAALTQVLGVVYRTISGFLLHRAGLTRATGATGAVTLVQRIGSALNLNTRFHMLFVDGVYLPAAAGPPVFRRLPAPTGAQLQIVVQQIAERVGHVLERRGLVERDMENAWLAGDGQAGPLGDLIGPSIAYRIAVGPRGRGPGRSCSRCRRCRPGCRARKAMRAARPARAGSRCTPASALRPAGGRSWSACAAT